MSGATAAERERRRLERKELRQAERRARIVEAARAILSSTGMADLTIEEVAARAGVGKPSVFYYFSSKQDLVGAVVLELVREETGALTAAVEACDGAVAALTTVVRALVRLYRDHLMTFRAHYLAPQVYGLTREHLEGMAPHTRAFFAACDAKVRADQRRGRLPRGVRAEHLTALAWTLGVGILFRASLLEPAGVRSAHAVDDLTDEACLLLSRSLA